MDAKPIRIDPSSFILRESDNDAEPFGAAFGEELHGLKRFGHVTITGYFPPPPLQDGDEVTITSDGVTLAKGIARDVTQDGEQTHARIEIPDVSDPSK